MELPADLQAALDHELGSVPPGRLSVLASELSDRYRGGQAGRTRFVQSPEDAAAYAAFRLPATFAAVSAALEQVRSRLPDFAPSTLLDVGAGPGTATWAAASLWPRNLSEITLLERDEAMMGLGKRLAARSSLRAVREASWLQADLLSAWEAPASDLVVASYVLGELPPAQTAAFLKRLWQRASVLVIIEPGTPAGSARISEARSELLALGADTTAPCPHNLHCPLAEPEWCHFSQRVARSRLHRQVKAGELAYEDEKFSFVAVSRLRGKPIPGRVLRHPQIRPGHIHLEVCTPEGVGRRTISRRDKELFRMARGLRWGSSLPPAGPGSEDPPAP